MTKAGASPLTTYSDEAISELNDSAVAGGSRWWVDWRFTRRWSDHWAEASAGPHTPKCQHLPGQGWRIGEILAV